MRIRQTGLLHHDPTRSYAGFTTITPFRHPSCYLVDMAGETVHQWDLPGALGSKAYLLPGGNLLCSVATDEGAPLKAAKGGRILELDWDGNVVWEHVDHDQHHDLRRLENGNTLYIAWEELSDEEASPRQRRRHRYGAGRQDLWRRVPRGRAFGRSGVGMAVGGC